MRRTLVGGTVLFDGTLIRDTTISCDGERIVGIGHPVGSSAQVDVRGQLVLPGIIDLHADAIERALEPRPGVRLPLPAALAEHDAWQLASGITTCFISLTDGFEPGLRSRELIRSVIEAVHGPQLRLAARTPVHLRREVCAPGDPDEIVAWMATRRISLLSINDHLPTGEDPGQHARSVASLRRRLNGQGADIENLLRAAQERRSSGEQMCERLCAAARSHAIPLASHDDATPAQAETSVARGATISEFPCDVPTAHHARELGAMVLMGAPNVVRGGSHVGWMSASDAVAAGACDALCSDYHPPSLLQAPFTLVERGICELPAAWDLVSAGPAAAAQLRDRGHLAVGALADLVLVEAEPRPRVRSVWVGGQEVARFR